MADKIFAQLAAGANGCGFQPNIRWIVMSHALCNVADSLQPGRGHPNAGGYVHAWTDADVYTRHHIPANQLPGPNQRSSGGSSGAYRRPSGTDLICGIGNFGSGASTPASPALWRPRSPPERSAFALDSA